METLGEWRAHLNSRRYPSDVLSLLCLCSTPSRLFQRRVYAFVPFTYCDFRRQQVQHHAHARHRAVLVRVGFFSQCCTNRHNHIFTRVQRCVQLHFVPMRLVQYLDGCGEAGEYESWYALNCLPTRENRLQPRASMPRPPPTWLNETWLDLILAANPARTQVSGTVTGVPDPTQYHVNLYILSKDGWW